MAGKLVLVAVYYTFDLDYPGVYGHNVMGIMNISSARDYLFNLQCYHVGLKIKLENIVCTMSLKITFLRLSPYLPGASEFLRITENSVTWDVRKICMFMVYK